MTCSLQLRLHCFATQQNQGICGVGTLAILGEPLTSFRMGRTWHEHAQTWWRHIYVDLPGDRSWQRKSHMKALSISCSDKGGCSRMVFLECNPHFILVLLGFHPMQQPQPDRPRLWGWLLPLGARQPDHTGRHQDRKPSSFRRQKAIII